MILEKMYFILQEARHVLRDKGHVSGGEVEPYIAGIRVVDYHQSYPGEETRAMHITPEEFRAIAMHMRGDNINEQAASRIAEIRELSNYQLPTETVKAWSTPIYRSSI